MPWQLTVLIIVCFYILLYVGSVYWFCTRPELEKKFKETFGISPREEKSKFKQAVMVKMRELTINWQNEIEKSDLKKKKSKELVKAEKDYSRAEQLAHHFRVEGF